MSPVRLGVDPVSVKCSNGYIESNHLSFHMSELLKLEQKIKDRIEQIRHKVHKTHNRAYTDSLWTEIETLNWVLNEILVLSQTA